MKYELTIRDKKFEVPNLEFGIYSEGNSEGGSALYIRASDHEEDIYTDSNKRDVWVEWLDSCCGSKDNPEDHVRKVVAEVKGGNDDAQLLRKVVIENAYISSFSESSTTKDGMDSYSYQVEIRRAPHQAGEISVSS